MKNPLPALLASLALVIPCHAAGLDRNADAAWKKVENAMRNVKAVIERHPRGSERRTDALVDYGAALKEFLAQAPNDPRRWKARIFDVDYYWVRSVGGPLPPVDILQTCEEILNAPDADATTKGEASREKVLSIWHDMDDGEFPVSDWVKLADAHFLTYPNCERNTQLKVLLDKARVTVGAMSKPLDLKFTAVDGSEIDLSKLRGKVVLLHFWNPLGKGFEAEVSKVTGAYLRQHPKGFETIGIPLNVDKPGIRISVKRYDMPWPQYFDGKYQDKNGLVVRFGIRPVPAMLLVDKKGMIVNTHASENLEAEVEKLLAE